MTTAGAANTTVWEALQAQAAANTSQPMGARTARATRRAANVAARGKDAKTRPLVEEAEEQVEEERE